MLTIGVPDHPIRALIRLSPVHRRWQAITRRVESQQSAADDTIERHAGPCRTFEQRREQGAWSQEPASPRILVQSADSQARAAIKDLMKS